MKGLIINLLAGSVLFAGALAGTLAATGRLNRAGVATIPGLAALFPAPPQAPPDPHAGEHGGDTDGIAAGAAMKPGERDVVDASHATAADEHGTQDPGQGGANHAAPAGEQRLKTGRSVEQPESKSGGGHGEAAKPDEHAPTPPGQRGLKTGRSILQSGAKGAEGHGAEPDAKSGADANAGHAGTPPVQGPKPGGNAAERDSEHLESRLVGDREQRYRPGAYFQFEGMPAGVTAEKINEAWQRVQEVTTDLEHRRTALDLRERELGVLADDVARRQTELGRERTELEALQKRLEERIEQFKEQVKLVRTDEVAGLRRNAATLSAFEPQKAAELVQDQWKTDQGQDEVLKTLEFMDKDAVNAILQALPNSMVREVLEKRLRVSKESPGTGGKGG